MVLVPFLLLAGLLSATTLTTCVGDFNPAILHPEGINALNSFHQSEFCNHRAVDWYKVVLLLESQSERGSVAQHVVMRQLRTEAFKEIIHKSKPVVSEVQEQNMQAWHGMKDHFQIEDQILFKDVRVPLWPLPNFMCKQE